MLDLRTRAVTNLPAMLSERCAHGSILFDGAIFVVGGQVEIKKKIVFLNSIETYVQSLLDCLLDFRFLSVNIVQPFLI